jgi:quercetin dioxygenase-like cupin family protein
MISKNNVIKIVNINKIDSDTCVFIDGSKRSSAKLSSLVIGRGSYQPGWRWSKDAGPQTGQESASHIGWIQSGKMVIRAENGDEQEVGPGDFFEVGPNHDAWVAGNEPCVALDFVVH